MNNQSSNPLAHTIIIQSLHSKEENENYTKECVKYMNSLSLSLSLSLAESSETSVQETAATQGSTAAHHFPKKSSSLVSIYICVHIYIEQRKKIKKYRDLYIPSFQEAITLGLGLHCSWVLRVVMTMFHGITDWRRSHIRPCRVCSGCRLWRIPYYCKFISNPTFILTS